MYIRRRLSSGTGAHDCGGGQVPSLPGGLETRVELMLQPKSEGRLLAELPLPPRTLVWFVSFSAKAFSCLEEDHPHC